MSNFAITDCWNRALGKLGAGRVASVNDQSPKARACQSCYDVLRQAELAANPWNFAVQRFNLPASATAEIFGLYTAYPLPAGWLRVLPPDPAMNYQDRDWIIEGNNVLSTNTAPLPVKLIMDIQDTSQWHPLFLEGVAGRMAWEMCEELTQSNTKKADLQTAYNVCIREAKKQNAIQKVPQLAVEDSWITVRAAGRSIGGWGPGWGSGG